MLDVRNKLSMTNSCCVYSALLVIMAPSLQLEQEQLLLHIKSLASNQNRAVTSGSHDQVSFNAIEAYKLAYFRPIHE